MTSLLSLPRLRPRLVLLFLAVGIVPLVAGIAVSNRLTAKLLDRQEAEVAARLTEQVQSKLQAIAGSRRLALERRFDELRTQLSFLASREVVADNFAFLTEAMPDYLEERGVDGGDSPTRALRELYVADLTPRGGYLEEGAEAWFDGLDPLAAALQEAYLVENEFAPPDRDRLRTAADDTLYDLVHGELHPAVSAAAAEVRVDDVLLIDAATSRVVYSLDKGADFGVALDRPPFSDSVLARAYRAALAEGAGDGPHFTDFDRYWAHGGEPAAFVAAPLPDRSGVLAFRFPIEDLTALVADNNQLGQYGQILLIGPDGRLRADARSDGDLTVAASFLRADGPRLANAAAAGALRGSEGLDRLEGLSGNAVMAAWVPVDALGVAWGLVVEADENEALSTIANMRAAAAADRAQLLRYVVLLALVASSFVILIAWKVSGSIAVPMTHAVGALERVAKGDLTPELCARSTDEIGRMAQAFNQTLEGMRAAIGADCVDWADVARQREAEGERIALAMMVEQAPLAFVRANERLEINYLNRSSEVTAARIQASLPVPVADLIGSPVEVFFGNQAEARRLLSNPDRLPWSGQSELNGEVLEFEVSAILDPEGRFLGVNIAWSVVTDGVRASEAKRQTVESLSACADTLRASAQDLIANADRTARSSSSTLEVSREMSESAVAVAAATEEMSASLNGITNSSAELADSVRSAVDLSTRAGEVMAALDQANSEVSRVTETIATIADQTNLLALNATIEAAGAGEVGRGFAVVASEIKELARGTMEATESIEGQVRDIRERSGGVSKSISEVGKVIEGLNHLATMLAGTVTEQSATTTEISGNVQRVAERSHTIAGDMDEISSVAERTNQAAQSVLAAAEQLGALAADLRSDE